MLNEEEDNEFNTVFNLITNKMEYDPKYLTTNIPKRIIAVPKSFCKNTSTGNIKAVPIIVHIIISCFSLGFFNFFSYFLNSNPKNYKDGKKVASLTKTYVNAGFYKEYRVINADKYKNLDNHCSHALLSNFQNLKTRPF